MAGEKDGPKLGSGSLTTEALETALKDLLPKPRPAADRLLAELDDLLRTLPPGPRSIPTGPVPPSPQALAWRGRATAVIISMQDVVLAVRIRSAFQEMSIEMLSQSGWHDVISILHEARYGLQLESPTTTTMAIAAQAPFDYFDSVRSKLATAQTEVFFVDAFIDAEFVARYLPQLRTGVSFRLLVREYASKVVPAAQLFSSQTGHVVEVRKAPNFHDRFVFIDRRDCYQSGSSFKDGGRFSPTTLTQMLDAAPLLLQTYEAIWQSSTPLYPQP